MGFIPRYYNNSVDVMKNLKNINNEHTNVVNKYLKDIPINNLVKNSKNIDSEYVDIVNKHFWDLI